MNEKALYYWKLGEVGFYEGFPRQKNLPIVREESFDINSGEYVVKVIVQERIEREVVLYQKYIAPIDGDAVVTATISCNDSSPYVQAGEVCIRNLTKREYHHASSKGQGYRESRIACSAGDIIEVFLVIRTLGHGFPKDSFTPKYPREVLFDKIKISFTDVTYTYKELIDSNRKKVLIIGDSTTGYYSNGESWVDILTRKHDDMFTYGVGFSGSSFCKREYEGFEPFTAQGIFEAIAKKDFGELLWEENGLSRMFYKDARMNAVECDVDKFDTVAFFMGYIDYFDGMPIYSKGSEGVENTFSNRIYELIKSVKNSMPDKEIVFILPYYNEQLNDNPLEITNRAGHTLVDYCDCIKDIIKKYFPQTKYIDLLKDFNLNKNNLSDYSFDKVHLTYEGLEKLADALYIKLKR